MSQAQRGRRDEERVLLCPSARSDHEGALVFGLVVGTEVAPEVAYLDKPTPITPALRALTEGLEPSEVFRSASRCVKHECRHYSGSHCSLGEQIVASMPAVTEALPPCAIRAHCRWFAEQRAAACMRCPQIVTDLPMAVLEEPVRLHKSRRQLPVV